MLEREIDKLLMDMVMTVSSSKLNDQLHIKQKLVCFYRRKLCISFVRDAGYNQYHLLQPSF